MIFPSYPFICAMLFLTPSWPPRGLLAALHGYLRGHSSAQKIPVCGNYFSVRSTEEVEFDDFTERSALTDRDVSDLNVPASGVQASCGWDAEKYKRKLRKLHLNEKKCIKTKLRKLQILH